MNNVLLYRIWFCVVLKRRNKKLKLPIISDYLYFDGYPRSGNTFTIGLIERIYPSLKGKGSHHLHSVAGLKIALKHNLKVLIIIRVPQDAIVSYLYTKRETKSEKSNLIDNLIIQYIDYYNFVFKSINKIKIINFDKMIKNEKVVMENFGDWISLNSEGNINDIILDYKGRMKNFQKVQNIEHSSMPNAERKMFKSENIDIVKNSIYYDKAISIHNKIIALSGL